MGTLWPAGGPGRLHIKGRLRLKSYPRNAELTRRVHYHYVLPSPCLFSCGTDFREWPARALKGDSESDALPVICPQLLVVPITNAFQTPATEHSSLS